MRTLYNTVLQYESILDVDQNEVMDRMDDDMIRRRILDYCTYKSSGACWQAASPKLKITKIDKDSKGWYIETDSGNTSIGIMTGYAMANSFLDCCTAPIHKNKGLKGFLVRDYQKPEIVFRWRKHKGSLSIIQAQHFESTEGLPEELDILQIDASCQGSKGFTMHNKIKVIVLHHTDSKLTISGNGCENIIVYPSYDSHRPNKIPSGAKLHEPLRHDDYIAVLKKLGF